MIPLHYKLSTKMDARGYQEIILIARNSTITSSAKSGISIDATYFDKAKGIDGESLNRKRLQTNEVKDARLALTKLHALRDYIQANIMGKPLDKALLQLVVNSYYNIVHSEEIQEELSANKFTLTELFERYLEDRKFNDKIVKERRVLLRALLRFEAFTRYQSNTDFKLDIDTISRDDIEAFKTYLEKEDKLSEKYPRLFAKLLSDFCISRRSNRNKVIGRGENTCIKMLKELKAFFTWLREKEFTKNNPFEGVKGFGMQIYGSPYYITVDERNKIANTEMPSKALEIQRDIFIFHCLVGCRISDLITLTESNLITEAGEVILQYVPQKTKNEKPNEKAVRVPLLPVLLEYIEKYKGVDAKGRLLPFISPQKYNDAIKQIFTIAGITKEVPLRNPRTGKTEFKPINEVASSHLARRTFVGNLYFKVQDPNLIGEMSGHTYGSKAFERYRNVEISTLSDKLKLVE